VAKWGGRPPHILFCFCFLIYFFKKNKLKNDTWQRYYRHVFIKIVFLKLFGSLGSQSSRVDSFRATSKTVGNL
jgi:hypothetical protein